MLNQTHNMEKYKVKRNFLNLMEGDTISFMGGYNEIFVHVEDRMNDVEKWDTGNKVYYWDKEPITPFTAMELKIPHTSKDKTKRLALLYSDHEWQLVLPAWPDRCHQRPAGGSSCRLVLKPYFLL